MMASAGVILLMTVLVRGLTFVRFVLPWVLQLLIKHTYGWQCLYGWRQKPWIYIGNGSCSGAPRRATSPHVKIYQAWYLQLNTVKALKPMYRHPLCSLRKRKAQSISGRPGGQVFFAVHPAGRK